MSRVLIDTNIFVYGIDEDSKYFDQAKQILVQTEKQLVTTSKNLIEFLTVVTKSKGYNLNSALALEIIEEIIQSVEVIYPTPVHWQSCWTWYIGIPLPVLKSMTLR